MCQKLTKNQSRTIRLIGV